MINERHIFPTFITFTHRIRFRERQAYKDQTLAYIQVGSSISGMLSEDDVNFLICTVSIFSGGVFN